MTGAEVKRLRTSYRLSVVQFADLIGASQSSVYRWETLPEPVIDFGQLRLLSVMQQVRSPRVVRRVHDGVTARGGLYGLYLLLDCLFGEG
jgi:hypothetical protein